MLKGGFQISFGKIQCGKREPLDIKKCFSNEVKKLITQNTEKKLAEYRKPKTWDQFRIRTHELLLPRHAR